MKLATFVFFGFALVCSFSNVESGKERKELRAAGPKVCSTQTFEKLETCCEFSKLLPSEAFPPCMKELRNIAQKYAKSKKSTKSKSGGILATMFQRKEKRRGQLPDPLVCAMECVLRNQTLLTTTGEIDVKATDKMFTAHANAAWLPIVSQSIQKCDAEMKKMDPKRFLPVQAGSDTQCKPNSAMFMSCVRHYMALACPAQFTKTSDVCTEKLTALKACDPFSVTASKN